MVLLKNWLFFHVFFLGNIGKENEFYDILERKSAFLGNKNKKFKKSKNWLFFHVFFLGNIGQDTVFYDILERKNAFLGNKNKKFKKSKNWHFSKGVNPWFSSKIGHFSNLFLFRQYRPRKCVLWYSRTKQRFSRQKNKKLKTSKNWHFSKGVNPWFCSKIGYFSNFFFRQYRPGNCVLWYSRTKKRLSRQ